MHHSRNIGTKYNRCNICGIRLSSSQKQVCDNCGKSFSQSYGKYGSWSAFGRRKLSKHPLKIRKGFWYCVKCCKTKKIKFFSKAINYCNDCVTVKKEIP